MSDEVGQIKRLYIILRSEHDGMKEDINMLKKLNYFVFMVALGGTVLSSTALLFGVLLK